LGKNSYWPKGYAYNYKVAYAVMASKQCESGLDDQIEVKHYDNLVDGSRDAPDKVPLYMHQCAYKCPRECKGKGNTVVNIKDRDGVNTYGVYCGCSTYDASTDTDDVFTVCGDQTVMKKTCDALPECFGFHSFKYGAKAFMLKRPCMLEALNGLGDSSTYDYYAKMDPESSGGGGGGESACPMGMAVLAEGLDDLAGSCSELATKEQYNPLDDKTFGTDCGTITWSPNGCGWLVQAPPTPLPSTTTVDEPCTYSACENKVAEANWIFGFEGTEYDVDICSRTEPWLAAPGYCQNALWKALCPESCAAVTCAVCETLEGVDNVEAADVLTEMLTLTVTTTSCAALSAANMCEDPVVNVVCLATCPGGVRRLTAETEAHIESMRHVYGTHFREQLLVLEQAARAAGRRLDDHKVTLYGSWDPTTRPDICADISESSTAPADQNLISTAQMWDWYTWLNTKYDINIAVSCPPQDIYSTASSKYCDENNMNIAALGDSVIEEQLCWKKCLALGTSTSGAADPLCAGMDPAFNSYSNALCVTRDTCETYCDSLGGMCTGFEMHKTVPRCYLISDTCGANTITSPLYDQVTKSTGLIRYKTYSDMTCDKRTLGSGSGTMVGTREECEASCSGDQSCGGFAYTKATMTCTFASLPSGSFQASKYCSGGEQTYAGQTGTVNNLDDDPSNAGTDWVEKVMAGFSIEQPWSPPCSAIVSTGPAGTGLIPGTASGTYTRKEAADCGGGGNEEVCYLSANSAYRLVWGSQQMFATTEVVLDDLKAYHRQCSGWVLEYKSGGVFTPMWATYLANTVRDGDFLECPTEPATYSLGSGYTGMYSWTPSLAAPVNLDFVCKSYPTCGTLQTCVLAKNRFWTETEALLTKDDCGPVGPYDFLSDGNTPCYPTLLDPVTFRPKTLISAIASKLFVAKVKEQYGKELYRNVPGHLRLKINDLGSDVTNAIITMISSATSYDNNFQFTINGRGYFIPEQLTDPKGYEPWYTDVVRLEKFDADGKVIENGAATVLDFYAPTSPNLMVVVFDKMSGDPIEYIDATAVPGSPGYWRVSATRSADYVGTSESPCPATPPSMDNSDMAGKTCPDLDAGATCLPTCASGYTAANGGLVCSKGKWRAPDGGLDFSSVCTRPADYEPEVQLFRLSHRSRLDYGWRIRSVVPYSDTGCSKKIDKKELAYVGPSESYQNAYPGHGDMQSYSKDSILTRSTNDESQCLKSSCKDFWSFGLNVNPYSVDDTHGSAAYVEFTVGADESVQCVEVTSRTIAGDGSPRQYYPDIMTLHRGYYADTAAGEETVEYSMISPKGWTEMWTSTVEESTSEKTGLVTKFITKCGTENKRIFGELIKKVDGVPSPCHCKQLCIDEIPNGCVSWNYYRGTGNAQECYLQSTIKFEPTETCESFVGWVSGTTGLRVDGISPATVTPGTAFTLEVSGTNFPTEVSAVSQKTTPPRQRIKIIPGGGVCAEAEVAPFVEGIGCSHPYFCAPKPTSTTATSASWSSLKIFSADVEKTYTVCYNRGLTYDRYEWYSVGELTVSSTVFTFSTVPATVKRTTPTIALTVGRPAFSDFSSVSGWAIKLVKSYFDCSKLSDAKIGLDLTLAVTASDSVEFPDIAVYDTASLSFADVGLYKVCFSKDGVTYEQIPSTTGDVYLEIVAEEGDSTHPRSVYSYQTLSGKIGESNTFTIKGNKLYLPSDSGIAFFNNDTCKGPSIFKATVDETASTADGYVFTGDIASSVTAGEYTICYCDDQEATNATGTGDRYTVTQDYVCASDCPNCAEGMAYGNLSSDIQADTCTVKCARGCTGADCYCDSFDMTDYVASPLDTASYPLCVSAATCKKHCSNTPTCTGFDYDPAKNMCTLLNGTCATLTYAEGSEFFDRTAGDSVCEVNEDFDTKIGTVTVAAKANIGVDWVLTPGETASIEVIGTNLNWQTDRLMVIDCTGICGISGPTASVSAGPKSQMQFNHWVAVMPDFDDPPADDTEVPGSYVAPVVPETVYWRYVDAAYCAGNNMDITTLPDVSRHQCFTKCAGATACTGDDCFCTGLMQGYDTESSGALCLDETECKNTCAGLEDCFGIDMHKTLPRCFLNMAGDLTDTKSCEYYVQEHKTTPFPTYKLIYKQETTRERRATATAPTAPATARSLLPTEDQGKSWDQILRFNEITFKTGGKFKACFCDPDTLAAGKYCKKAEDYKIEIGTIHVSGVSCLVADAKFQRGTCVAQYHGEGMRCYPDSAPTLTVPTTAAAYYPNQDYVATTTFDPALSAFCLYGVEEETKVDPLCNL
jgi:hypothetical protein